jgi:FKBP-type peptidyl-prolyl cis-trans isomerase FkpA
MKNFIVSVIVCLLILPGTGCLKDNSCNPKTVASERTTMTNFATANGLTVTEHSSGFQYQIISAGAGQTPTLSSTVSVRYTGKLMDGTIFDSATGTPVTFPLSQVIPGWQLAVPLIQEGGLIRIILPSSLAYGCTGAGTIPGDAVLYFEIQLVDVQ